MNHRLGSRILVLGSIAMVLTLAVDCGDDKPSGPPVENQEPLVFTRENSSRIQFPSTAQTYVWCGPWEEDDIPTPALHVWFGSLTATDSPGWELKGVHGDFSPGDTLRFPEYFIWDHPDSVHIFLWDPPNELATDTEDASGYIVFRHVPCAGENYVEFDIDAVLGSELGGMPTVTVRGRYKHSVTGAPPWRGTSREVLNRR